MERLVISAVVFLTAGAVPAVAGPEEAPAKVFEDLFGSEAKKVSATRATSDDARFAATLLEAGASVGTRKALQVLLYEKAVEFGARDPAGCETAVLALQKLLAAAADREGEWQEKLLEIREQAYRRSDRQGRAEAGQRLLDQLLIMADSRLAAGEAAEARDLYRRAAQLASTLRSPRREAILEQVKVATAKLAAEGTCKALRARLEKDPDNGSAREALIRLYVLELDNPVAAAKLIRDGVDAGLRAGVSLAAKPPEELEAPAVLELAQWYEGLAASAETAGRITALQRAGQYYQQYLLTHTTDDIPRLKAKLALQKIEKDLAAVGGLRAGLLKKITLDLGGGAAMKLALIPAGAFLMGHPKDDTDRDSRAEPQHPVKIARPFYLGITEVTQEQYQAVSGSNPSKNRGPTKPVDNVSWDEALAFCKKLSAKTGRFARLPTEAEWEYACRAGTTTRYCSGDSEAGLGQYGWHHDNSGGRTHVPGELKPNGFGLYDMHGNVYEWVGDYYGRYPSTAQTDPTGADTGTERVLRGGSFWYSARECRSARRYPYGPDKKWSNVGFRVVVTVPEG